MGMPTMLGGLPTAPSGQVTITSTDCVVQLDIQDSGGDLLGGEYPEATAYGTITSTSGDIEGNVTFDGTSSVALDDQTGHLLRCAHKRASAIFASILSDHQLTPPQYFAMVRLSEVGRLSQNHLGRMTAMHPATIQGVIQRLCERGLITRTHIRIVPALFLRRRPGSCPSAKPFRQSPRFQRL